MGMEIAELNSLYMEAETAQQALFAEQRSNLLLVAGNHYNRRDSRFWRKLREIENISKEQKLRLTKNHIQRVTKGYRNNIVAFVPGVAIAPKNEAELTDQKSAEMYGAVWEDIKDRYKFRRKVRHYAQDLVEIGETITKIFYDPNLGTAIGEEPEIDEETGEPVVDEETGEPVMKQVMSGQLVYERIHGFNLLTDPEARSWDEVRWVCYRKMVAISELKLQFENDESKLQFITKGTDETYKVFDSTTGSYVESKGLMMVTEWYWRPCEEYRKGWYVISVKGGVLFEGELPLGIFPILYCGFDEASTSARSYSIIKQCRPYQAEINRAASKIAEHQITLGDDKLLMLNGSTMAPGGTAHGVKAIQVVGTEPKIMGGRNGEQYVGYMAGQIDEMYRVANYDEDSAEKDSANVDPYTLLFKTASKKKRYAEYLMKFEEYLIDICDLSLRLAKAYYPDQMLVQVVGKSEFVNIAEFRNSDDLGYQIKIESQSDDLESRMGRQLSLNHLIQYAGANMAAEDLGRVVAAMDYLNDKQLFDDRTIDYQNASNDILAMDRGEYVPAYPEDKHEYVIKRLTHRMKQRDYQSLVPQTQQNYQRKRDEHRQIFAQQVAAAQQAEAGFVPSGGMLVTCDFYQPDPKDPLRPKRLRIPSEALQWLIDKLQSQGTTQQALENQDLQTQASIAEMLKQQRQPQWQLPVGQSAFQ